MWLFFSSKGRVGTRIIAGIGPGVKVETSVREREGRLEAREWAGVGVYVNLKSGGGVGVGAGALLIK